MKQRIQLFLILCLPLTLLSHIAAQNCTNDRTPPVFKNCVFTFNGLDGSQIVLLTDSDSIPLTTSLYPSVSDNCTPNSTVRLVVGAPENQGFTGKVRSGSILRFEAIDGALNKSECLVRYTFLVRSCANQGTCIRFPASGNVSDYIVVSSSGANAAARVLVDRVDIVQSGGQLKCFTNSQPFQLTVYMPTKDQVNSGQGVLDTTGLVKFNPITVTPCSPCDFDTIPPKFTTCPQNITTTTATDCAPATWTTPTATDNCSTPSVKTTSTRLSGACFPLGTTAVVYTASDSARNTATCSFSITVNKQALCKSYDVFYTNNVCACEDTRWQPYGFYLEGANGCPADLFKPTEGVRFQINSDKTATLKGQFRNNRTWELVVVDVILSGQTTTAPTGSPNLTFCQRGRSNAVAATWQYFTGMSGTVKTGAKTLTINRLGAAFQIGFGANNQNVDLTGASGRFTLSDGRTGNFGLMLTNEVSFGCGSLPNAANDIQVSLTTNSPNFVRFASFDYTVSVKNTGSTTMKNAIVEFRFPSGTVNGGTVTPSVGTWQEWCAGNIQCFQWTIPTLAAGSGGTLKVPVFVSGGDAPISATAKLLASSPIDGNAANNQATVTVTAITRSQGGSAVQQLVQLIPVVIQKAFPNPTDTELNIQLNSLDSREVAFEISNSMGQILKNERVNLKKGANKVLLDVSALPSGIYFVTPRSNAMRNVPVKFIKM